MSLMYLPIVLILLILSIAAYLIAKFVLKKTPQEVAAQEKADEIIHSAAQRADQIVSQAEVEGVKIASETKLGANLFQQTYDQKLEAALEEARKQFADDLQRTQQNYQGMLGKLEQDSAKQQQELEELMKTKINDTLLKFEQNLSNYLTSAEQKSFEAINLELKSARQLIDTYKTQQLQLIDENIVAVLERTLSLVTRNKLSLKEQLDLVYEALEKAKVEKFFA